MMFEMLNSETENFGISRCDSPIIDFSGMLETGTDNRDEKLAEVEIPVDISFNDSSANVFSVAGHNCRVKLEVCSTRNNDSKCNDRRTSMMSFKSNIMNETMLSCFLESVVPLTLAGVGQICAGLYLDYISSGTLFTRIPEAMALVTPLLNLKGNLEMNFASRLATYCHTGDTKHDSDLMRLGGANHGLSQTHTIITSFILALICIFINFSIPMANALIFIASTISTASLASFTIETVLLFVIILARWLKINPDNVATPIAATVGDLSTLFFYASLGYIFVSFCSDVCLLSLGVIGFSIALIPFYIRLAQSHPSTRRALVAGWFTLMVSAIISSGGGVILQRVHLKYKGYALLQPLIVGLVGNMCGIQTSRLGSALHVRNFRGTLKFGEYPNKSLWGSLNPFTTFFSSSIHSKTAILMVLMAIPSQLVFALIALFIGGKLELITWKFCVGYCICCFLLVSLFIYLCRVFVHLFWRLRHDPDYSVIPIITALCDFTGSFFLCILFVLLEIFTSPSVGNMNDPIFADRFEQ